MRSSTVLATGCMLLKIVAVFSPPMTGAAENQHIIRYYILWIYLLAVLAPVITISLFNHPVGDDYWLSAMIRNHGAREAFEYVHKNVSARYTAVAMMSVNPLVFGDYYFFRIIPVVFILLFVCVLAGFLRTLLSSGSNPLQQWHPMAMALVIAAMYIAVMPGIGEGLFWVSSLVGYQFAILFSLVWARLVITWYHSGHRKPGILIGAAAAFILLCGANEIFAFLGCSTVLLIVMSRLRTKSGIDSLLVVHVVLALPIAAVIWASPSLTSRYMAAIGATSTTWVSSLTSAGAYLGYHTLKLLINPFFWAAVLLLVRLLSFISVDTAMSYYCRRHRFIIIFICAFVMLFTEFVAIHFSGNKVPPLRITNISIFFLLICLLLMGLAYHTQFTSIYKRFAQVHTPVVVILTAIGFVTPNNISTASKELVAGKVFRYDAEMTDRFSILRICESDTCAVPRLRHLPKTIRYSAHDDFQHLNEYFHTTIVYKE